MLDPLTRDAIQSRAVELLRSYLPALRPQGRQWITHCPFHDDTTPSFVVSPEKGLFHCHGCKVGGDMLTFVQRFKRLSFPDALAEAAQMLGLVLPARKPEDPHITRLAASAETVADIFTSWLWHEVGTPARLYLQQRGIAEDTARRFRLGFHPDHPTLLLTAFAQHDLDLETAQQLGLLTQKRGHWIPVMRGRLIFPICDRAGTVHGFGARALTDSVPKYLNSPASPLFHKGRLLYGLPQAIPAIQQEQQALIVEGYVDVLTLSQAGLRHAVAPMATALTPEHLSVVRSLAHRVTLLFDGDRAGHDATVRALAPVLNADLHAEVARLPQGSDPDAYLRRHGAVAFQDVLTRTVSLSTFVFDTWRTCSETGTTLRNIVTLAGQISDPVARLTLVQEAEQQFRLPPGSVMEAAGIGTAARQQLEDLLCGLFLTMPEVRARLQAHPLPFSQPALREIATYVRRQTPYPQHLTAEARRLVSLVAQRHRITLRHLPTPVQHDNPRRFRHEQ